MLPGPVHHRSNISLDSIQYEVQGFSYQYTYAISPQTLALLDQDSVLACLPLWLSWLKQTPPSHVLNDIHHLLLQCIASACTCAT